MDIGRKIGSILVAEDDSDTRELLIHRISNTTPFEVVSAVSGNDAIKILKQRTDFCGIISDYNMADGNGRAVQDFLVNQNLQIALLFYTSEENPSVNPYHKFYLGKVSKPHVAAAVTEIRIRIFKRPFNLSI